MLLTQRRKDAKTQRGSDSDCSRYPFDYFPYLFVPLRLCAFALALLALTSAQAALAQSPDDPPGRWPLEVVLLADGSSLRGLVQGESDAEVDFAQIIQPPGKPMYAVIRGIPRAQVEQIERLPGDAHDGLVRRFALFRSRAVIEAGRMDAIKLSSLTDSGTPTLHYDGPWFRLVSTANEEQTRRCLVRIEQLFRAYRTLLPPRKWEGEAPAEPRPLAVHLFGSTDEYRGRLRELDLTLDNAAFYSPRQATILAASDLNLFADRLAQVRREHQRVRQDMARLDGEHAKKLLTLQGELRAAGFSAEEASAEIRQRRATWKKELEATLATNRERERTAEQKFAALTDKMFASLAHESFHAWLDSYVYPHDRHHVPRWLNEGLAQIFESGQLDGDALRLDAPDKSRLAALQADLASSSPLPLAEVLAANEREFLGPHGSGTPQRQYLYAWGLAYYLTFHENLLASGRLDTYVSQRAQRLDPVAGFEKLVGRSLPEFEKTWRDAMRK